MRYVIVIIVIPQDTTPPPSLSPHTAKRLVRISNSLVLTICDDRERNWDKRSFLYSIYIMCVDLKSASQKDTTSERKQDAHREERQQEREDIHSFTNEIYIKTAFD